MGEFLDLRTVSPNSEILLTNGLDIRASLQKVLRLNVGTKSELKYPHFLTTQYGKQ
jgi:hypothetical protein